MGLYAEDATGPGCSSLSAFSSRRRREQRRRVARFAGERRAALASRCACAAPTDNIAGTRPGACPCATIRRHRPMVFGRHRYPRSEGRRGCAAAQRGATADAQRELQLTVDSIPVTGRGFSAGRCPHFVNRTWRDYTGLDPRRINREAGRIRISIPTMPSRSNVHSRRHWRPASRSRMRCALRRADGEYRWHWIRRVPVRDDRDHHQMVQRRLSTSRSRSEPKRRCARAKRS